jgi:hypothetical protein
MLWLFIVVVAAGVVVLARIVMNLRKLRQTRTDDWDAQLIARLRAQGSDPFQPHAVDFFFALPSAAACDVVRKQLEFDGFAVDTKPVPDSSEHPFSLHAAKDLRLSVPDMRALSARFGDLARVNGGRYDGWTAGVVRQRRGAQLH